MALDADLRSRHAVISESPVAARWWLFCLLILTVKLLLLGLDPLPKVFMGDSGSYLHTAITGWIPDDRSYWYGYLIRFIALPTHSLFPLLLLQCYLSGLTAIVATVCWRFFFGCSTAVAYSLGFACALDPLQLLWERYVMTETISLFFYVLFLYCALRYIQSRRRRDLVLVQLLGVATIGFRMSYLLVVQLTALLPLLAYFPDLLRHIRTLPRQSRSLLIAARRTGIDTLLSLILMFSLHRGYTEVNGWLTNRQPAYLYATGLHLLAFWAPVLKPQDAVDPRLAAIIQHGGEYSLTDPTARNSQRFFPTGLIGRLTAVEKDPIKANDIAQQTAMRALHRAPFQVALLALKTYAQFLDPHWLKQAARADFGHDLLPANLQALKKHFGWSGQANITAARRTFLQRYYLKLWPYYFVIAVSPAIALVAIWLSRDWRLPALLFAHNSVMLVTASALAPQAVVRYLQPMSLLTLLSIGILLQAAIQRWSEASFFPLTMLHRTAQLKEEL